MTKTSKKMLVGTAAIVAAALVISNVVNRPNTEA